MRIHGRLLASCVVAMAFIIGAGVEVRAQHDHHHGAAKPAQAVSRAIAVLVPTAGNHVTGTVVFTQTPGGLRVVADVSGLTPGKHGFHVHEFGDCSAPDGMSAGGHYNPSGMPHSAPTAGHRHAGDLGNLVAGPDGKAHLEWVDPVLGLEGPASVIGRSVVVHEKEDDLKSQPTGNAGPRVACGVIGVAKPGEPTRK